MKKLKLTLNKEILSKDQMKKIVGGSGFMKCQCGGTWLLNHQTSDGHCPSNYNSYCTTLWQSGGGTGTCIGCCDNSGGGANGSSCSF